MRNQKVKPSVAKGRKKQPAPPKPEVVEFVARTEALRLSMGCSRATLSKRLFNKRALVIDDLANGYGVSVVAWLEALRTLEQLEAEYPLYAESAA